MRSGNREMSTIYCFVQYLQLFLSWVSLVIPSSLLGVEVCYGCYDFAWKLCQEARQNVLRKKTSMLWGWEDGSLDHFFAVFCLLFFSAGDDNLFFSLRCISSVEHRGGFRYYVHAFIGRVVALQSWRTNEICKRLCHWRTQRSQQQRENSALST